MTYAIVGLYALIALIGLINLFFMRRPSRSVTGPKICVLIPARDEERNLERLLPSLLEPNPGLEVYVFDDESTDKTALVPERFGAHLVQPTEPLPKGWTGKNRACHLLALSVLSWSDADWILFLDADVRPGPEFIPAMRSLCESVPPNVGMITGFPKVLPGRGIEPMFLAWVGWVLLVSNPYALVSLTGKGHSRFKNGQVHCWRREVYESVKPNEAVKSRIMEDVSIGRLLAKLGIGVEVANLSSVLQVKMYENWRETLDGMSKNSYEIANSDLGSLWVALLLLFLGWGWLLAGKLAVLALALLVVSGLSVVALCRTAVWPVLLMPLVPTVASFTVLRSLVWHRRGAVKWKGRVYDRKDG